MARAFNPNAAGFDLANCRAALDHACLAYAGNSVITARLTMAGFTSITFIDDPATDTHGYLALCDSYAVLSFRGSASLRNWLTDLDAVFTRVSSEKIHQGFFTAFSGISQYLSRVNRRLLICGHSLGGALAMLAADDFVLQPDVHSIYTFGQPRVGDGAFAKRYNAAMREKTFRIVNQVDPVPRMPWMLGRYVHAGNEVFVDLLGNLVTNPPWPEKLPTDAFCIAHGLAARHSLVDVPKAHFQTSYQAAIG